MNWKQIVSSVAPVLGTALGGPLAGAATKFIADKFLGNPQASEQDIAQAISGAKPEDLLKFKELDQQFSLETLRISAARESRQYENEEKKIALDTQDTQNARNFRIESVKAGISQAIPNIIAILFILGFFAFVYMLLTHDIDVDVKDTIFLIAGYMISELGGIIKFYFGSSAGSKAKDIALLNKTKN